MRVGEGPHEPTRFVGDIQVSADFEPVERLQHEAQGGKHQQRPPPDTQVAGGIVHVRA